MACRIEAFVFDLGGVVLDIDFDRVFANWARSSGLPESVVRERFQFDEAYEQHERGELSAANYHRSVSERLGVELSFDDWKRGWNDLFLGLIPDTLRLVEGLASRYPVHGFTNTNETHRLEWFERFPQLATAMHSIFISSRIGLRKPEAAAFEHICDAIDVRPEQILFFDDTLANVEGARAAGLQGVHVRSAHDVVEALTGYWD
jgi:putative hydrolase of the HAD superfamily